MKSTEIRYVLALARYRSITKAADALFISQPALSRFLGNLEKSLGGALFKRDSTGLSLTSLGETWVYYAEKIDRLEQECNASIYHQMHGEQTIRLGVPNCRSNLLATCIADFQQANPEYDVQVISEYSARITEMLLKGQLDLAFVDRRTPEKNDLAIVKEEILLYIPEAVQHICFDKEQLPYKEGYPILPMEKVRKVPFYISGHENMLGRVADAMLQSNLSMPEDIRRVAEGKLAYHMARQHGGICFVCIPSDKQAMADIPQDCLFRLKKRYFNTLCLGFYADAGNRLRGIDTLVHQFTQAYLLNNIFFAGD